ncbi:MAG: preprotein translocase subunit SecG [Patescibacteria group bacterium]
MNFLAITQIIVSAVLVALILLQQRGSEGLGSAFGGDSSGALYRTRRGAEKIIFLFTIILSIFFVALAIASFYFV